MKIKNQPKERLMLSWVYILSSHAHVFLKEPGLFHLYWLPCMSDREADLRAQALKEP